MTPLTRNKRRDYYDVSFMTLNDNTEIVHSEMHADGRVKVYIEQPDAETCFNRAVCWLPDYTWEDVQGLGSVFVKDS